MSAQSSGSGRSGCGIAVIALLVISVALAILSAIWWLLLILAIAAIVGAFAIRKKNESEPDRNESDPYYTQKCPNCGAQIRVSVYERTARCEYCDSGFPATREPLTKEEKPKDLNSLLKDPFKTLIAAAVVLAVLGVIGLGFNLSSNSGSSLSSRSSGGTAVSASSTASASSQSASSTSPQEKAKNIAHLTVIDESVSAKSGKVEVSLTVRNDSEYTISSLFVAYRFEDEKGKETPDRGAEGPSNSFSIGAIKPGEERTLTCKGFDYGDSLPVYSFELSSYDGTCDSADNVEVILSGNMERSESIEALKIARNEA